jgi:hypothetical protein
MIGLALLIGITAERPIAMADTMIALGAGTRGCILEAWGRSLLALSNPLTHRPYGCNWMKPS